MVKRVAVVTGANKGIGFQVVKFLCSQFQGDVFLCSRDRERGETAVAKLNEIGFKPIFFKLDITSKEDVARLRNTLESEYKQVDLLINNAAVNFVPRANKSAAENTELQVNTIKTNYFATADLCDAIFPIMRAGGRVVNVSSAAGMLKFLKNQAIADKLTSADLTREQLDGIANEFIDDLKNGRDEANGWPLKGYAYFASKILLSALTWIQQRQMSPRDIAVFATHPGFVQTDMTGHMGNLTPEQGAGSTVFAALHAKPGDEYIGRIIFPDNEPRDWAADDAFGDGTTFDHALQLTKGWMAKLAEE